MAYISFVDLTTSLTGEFTFDTYAVRGPSADDSSGDFSSTDFSPTDFIGDFDEDIELVVLDDVLTSIHGKAKLDNCTVQEAIDSLGYNHVTDVISAYVTDSHSAEEFAELAEAHLHVFKH